MDSNALFLPFQFGINLDAELTRLLGIYDYVVPSSVVDELRRLREAGEPHAREAVALLEHLGPEVVPGSSDADRDVIEVAGDRHGVLLTLDADVRRAALSAGVPVILMRGRKYLVLRRPAGL